jgi:hypothetical protein
MKVVRLMIFKAYFKQMFLCTQPNFVSIYRYTFIKLLDREFDNFGGCVVILLGDEKENSYGAPVISVCHDMWTTITNDNMLGSSVRLITRDFASSRYIKLLVYNT